MQERKKRRVYKRIHGNTKGRKGGKGRKKIERGRERKKKDRMRKREEEKN